MASRSCHVQFEETGKLRIRFAEGAYEGLEWIVDADVPTFAPFAAEAKRIREPGAEHEAKAEVHLARLDDGAAVDALQEARAAGKATQVSAEYHDRCPVCGHVARVTPYQTEKADRGWGQRFLQVDCKSRACPYRPSYVIEESIVREPALKDHDLVRRLSARTQDGLPLILRGEIEALLRARGTKG